MRLALLALAACTPTVVWSGHTADRRHAIEIVQRGDHQRVLFDGRELTAGYTAIAATSVETAGGRVAYAARLGQAWIVVDPGRASPRWDGIGEVVLAGDHTAYVAERAGRWHVVVDGRSGPGWDAVLAGTLQISGAHVAYIARDGGGAHVVVDGRVEAACEGVAELVLSADGAHHAYVARAGERAAVVVDGEAGASYREIRKLRLDGSRAFYAARDDIGWHVVAGDVSPPYREVRAIVTRGGHAAWVARDGDADVVGCDRAIVGRASSVDAERVALVGDCEVVYAVLERDTVRVMRGARRLGAFDSIGALVVAPGDRVAFAARTGDTAYIVIDGDARAVGAYAGDPVFSGDGARLGYIARHGKRWAAVVDGEPHELDLVLDGTLAFSRDGRHWAVIAGDLEHERLFFAIDGSDRVPLATAEIYSAGLRAGTGDRGAVLREWSAAEASRR